MAEKHSSQSEDINFDLDGMWLKKPEIIKQFIEQRSDHEKLCAEVAYILTRQLNFRLNFRPSLTEPKLWIVF